MSSLLVCKFVLRNHGTLEGSQRDQRIPRNPSWHRLFIRFFNKHGDIQITSNWAGIHGKCKQDFELLLSRFDLTKVTEL